MLAADVSTDRVGAQTGSRTKTGGGDKTVTGTVTVMCLYTAH